MADLPQGAPARCQQSVGLPLVLRHLSPRFAQLELPNPRGRLSRLAPALPAAAPSIARSHEAGRPAAPTMSLVGAALLCLAFVASPAAAATFETAIVNGELAISSSWESGFCGQLV